MSLREQNWHARHRKKALIEAQSIVAKNDLDQSAVEAPPDDEPPAESTKNVLTTTQWLSVISIIVSLAGVHYKREEIKSVFTKKRTPVLPQDPPPSPAVPPAVPLAHPPSLVNVMPKRKVGNRKMD